MCDHCDWVIALDDIDTALERIDEMPLASLPDTAEDFASSAIRTLEGIRDWVGSHEHVTEAQMGAITNIRSGVEKWFHDGSG